MEQKKIIDQTEVERVQKSNTAGFYAVVSILLLGALLSFIFIPLPANIIVGIAFLAVDCLMLRSRKKKGALQVYFSEKPLVRKLIKEDPFADEGTEANYFDFGDHEIKVPDEKYKKAAEGDLFYVMYDARNGRIVDCYAANEYELDPSLDIR